MKTFRPFPQNPTISKIFREIGLADELGSGMRNTNKYTALYLEAETYESIIKGWIRKSDTVFPKIRAIFGTMRDFTLKVLCSLLGQSVTLIVACESIFIAKKMGKIGLLAKK